MRVAEPASSQACFCGQPVKKPVIGKRNRTRLKILTGSSAFKIVSGLFSGSDMARMTKLEHTNCSFISLNILYTKNVLYEDLKSILPEINV